MNPNTGTLPMFRTRADADITLGIYRRHPVLIRDAKPAATPGNCLRDALRHGERLRAIPTAGGTSDLAFNGWSYEGQTEYLPLYEAKMLGHFDHRFSTYKGATQAQLNVGSLPRPTTNSTTILTWSLSLAIGSPDRRWHALEGKWDRDGCSGGVTSPSRTMRTFVPSVLPTSAVGNAFLLAFPGDSAHVHVHAVWSSLPFDYVARQKLSGTRMNYFTVKQIACPTPLHSPRRAWQPDCTLAEWVTPYILELSYTSWRLQPYARRWATMARPSGGTLNVARCYAPISTLQCSTSTASPYRGRARPDSFTVVRKYEERDHGEYRTRRLVLEAYDRMAEPPLVVDLAGRPSPGRTAGNRPGMPATAHT